MIIRPVFLPLFLFAAVLPRDIDPYLSMMIAGFVVAILGHLTRARWLVAVGIMLIVLSALVFPLTKVATEETPPPPSPGLEGL